MAETLNYTVYFFGDSITWGMSDPEGGWAKRTRQHFKETMAQNSGLSILDYNLGIPGNTAEDLVNRFDREFQSRQMAGWKNIAVFAIGTNDSQYHLPKQTPRYTDDVFQSYLIRLITAARQNQISNIAFVGLMPVDEKQTVPLPGFPDFATPQEQMKNKNAVIKAVCEKFKVTYIDLECDFDQPQNYMNLLDDGMHPNHLGHELIEQKVMSYFEQFFDLKKQPKNEPSVKR